MWQSSIKNGGKVGLKTTWTLGKIIFPITLIVSMFNTRQFYLGLFNYLSHSWDSSVYQETQLFRSF